MVDTLSLLQAAPAALARVDHGGQLLWCNPAAQQLLAPARIEAGTSLAIALGVAPQALAGAPADPVPAPGSGRWLRWRCQALPDGTGLLHLEDAGAQVALAREVQRQRERLDLAQDFGRLGIWERDVQTLQGRWDRHVYKFWGLDAEDEAPDFEAATRAIVDEDRAGLEAAFRASMAQPGTYSHRYRVRRPDGAITHLHSQWVVTAGADGRPARALGILMDDTESVQSAHERTAMESHLALAEQLAGLALWRHDLRTNRMHYNQQALAVLDIQPGPEGVPLDEVRALIHPDDLPLVVASAQAALDSDEPIDVDARYRRRDGSWCHVLTRRVVQRDAGGQPVAFVGVALDITARTEALQRAQTLARRFDLAARTAGIGYWARENDAERAYWSEQMRALHGLAADAQVPTLKEWLAQYLHPEDRGWVGERFRAWLSGQVPMVRAELRIVRADGAVRHLLTHSQQEPAAGRPVQFGIVVDVTERRLADLALRRAEQRAALAARGAGLGTWELDLQDGSAYWDAQMWQLRGVPARSTPPSPEELLSFVHPQDLDTARRQVSAARDDPGTLDHQFRVVWPDGSVHWLASRSASIDDAQGRALRRIGVNWDVTAVRRADEERQERETAQRASQAKSQFLARMSHELRTPLNAVLGFTQLLIADEGAGTGAAPAPEQRLQRLQRLQHIRAAGEHLLSLINDVLDLASLDAGELRVVPVRVALAPLLADTLPLLEPLRAACGVTLHSALGDLAVQADPTRLRQVLLNLLSNACKYNREGGRVELTAEAADAEVRLQVRDTGRGMSDAQLRQLFQPFNRLGVEREGIEGTGIGLAIVQALVRGMGGRIAVHSQLGEGSRFDVWLPAARTDDATGALAGAAAPASGAPAAPRHTLLYIEDNAVNTLIVRELLERRPDIALHTAGDGAAGLAAARRLRPALLLLDMQLPDMAGLEVLRRLRADPATVGLCCIALSANALPEDIALARAAGVADYWTKPLDLSAFLAALDKLFGPAPRA